MFCGTYVICEVYQFLLCSFDRYGILLVSIVGYPSMGHGWTLLLDHTRPKLTFLQSLNSKSIRLKIIYLQFKDIDE